LVGTSRSDVRSAQRADPTTLLALLQRARAGIHHVLAEQLLDAQELIVFRQPIEAAEGAGLDLTAIRRHGDIGGSRVLGFAEAIVHTMRWWKTIQLIEPCLKVPHDAYWHSEKLLFR